MEKISQLSSVVNLDLTLDSGQVFLWNKLKNNWYGIHGSNVVKLAPHHDQIESDSYPEEVDCNNMFRMDDDINNILHSISKDAVVVDALNKLKGLRLMRQDPYQCLISFMCATNTSIFMIRQMLTNMSNIFGRKIRYDGFEFHSFPAAKKLANATINDLCKCSVGFRARFIRRAAKAVVEQRIDFNYLRRTSYESAKKELMEVLGIGEKVSDCILLFSLEKLESFPIDVWIARAIMNYYINMFKRNPKDPSMSPRLYRTLSGKMREYFGAYAGYAQQYLYCYARANKISN